jgi:glycolate oxidase iron-sulfur subunit
MAQRRFGWLVTPCGSCASCVKEHWRRHREFFTGADLRMIDYLGENTCDICCYLTRVLKVPFPEAGAGAGDPAEAGKTEPEGALSPAPAPRVTYHDACHLRKSLGVWREPREILKSLPGWSYAEMPEAERCCGGGGSFTLEHGELSEKIGARKRKNILSVSPHTVAAACPACALQLTDTLSRGGDKVRVRHVIELYADTLPDEAGALGNGAGPKALGGGSGPEASGNESGPGASKNGPGAPGPAPKTV